MHHHLRDSKLGSDTVACTSSSVCASITVLMLNVGKNDMGDYQHHSFRTTFLKNQ
jgi:hypothetical protein